jgi:hypothetical protein
MADLISRETRELVLSIFIQYFNDIKDEIEKLKKYLEGKLTSLEAI